MELYSNAAQFSPQDLSRIADLERRWLRKASVLFFGSEWAQNIAIEEYGLEKSKTHVLWLGGNVGIPSRDRYAAGQDFLFISLNFGKKGGEIASRALQSVRRRYPKAQLLVVGAPPPPEILALPGIKYCGMLRKTMPNELAEFKRLLGSARALVHPTTMDTMGAVLVEAGYFGCPSIATNRFGIPELVHDGRTGMLVDAPIEVEQVASQMERMLDDEPGYLCMRKAVRSDMTSRLSWDSFGSKMVAAIASLHLPGLPSDKHVLAGDP
ncbi:glycosyltransferase family 4 protein [Posidoniimonas polymericola]|nr:glycosyltransferase family 4 protein [Posidoniimonas polymericola]